MSDFVRRPEWRSLPIAIKVAIVHIWRSEHEPLPPPSADEGMA